KCLQDAFNIPYFAEAIVNGKAITLDHVLADGDRLEFAKAFGYKSHKKESQAKAEAKGLLSHYPELVEIGNKVKSRGLDAERSVEVMAVIVARWCEDHFGPIANAVVPTLNEIVSKLTRLNDRLMPLKHGRNPRKPGRKSTTRELADFAHAHS